MTPKPVIRVEGVHKIYRVYRRPIDRLRELLPWRRGRKLHREVHALKGIDLEVMPGQCVGLIGGNGAGKSTLLKVLTGTTFPTRGSYSLRGDVAALLELGAGFNPMATGRANIFMNAALMGSTREETQEKFQQILDFSELHQFIDQPIRTYSSGMVARLGFSVAVARDPDVLIIDEILSVGDMHFKRKCVDKIMSFKEQGKTMFFCSHSLYDVRQICERAIWMRDGRMEMFDDSVTVTNEYATYENQIIASQDRDAYAMPLEELGAEGSDPEDFPRVVSAHLIDPATGEVETTFKPGDAIGIRIHVKSGRRYEPLAIGVGFARNDGTLCFAPTTEMDGVPLEFGEGIVTLILPKLALLSGEFTIPIWLLDARGVHRFHETACTENLVVQNRTRELGLFYAERNWAVEVLQPAPVEEHRA